MRNAVENPFVKFQLVGVAGDTVIGKLNGRHEGTPCEIATGAWWERAGHTETRVLDAGPIILLGGNVTCVALQRVHVHLMAKLDRTGIAKTGGLGGKFRMFPRAKGTNVLEMRLPLSRSKAHVALRATGVTHRSQHCVDVVLLMASRAVRRKNLA